MLSLVMVLLMAFPWVSAPATAASKWSELEIYVSWTDGSGNTQGAMASPLGWMEESVFWVQISSDAPLQSLTLSLSAPGHSDYVYDAGEGVGNMTLTNVQNASGLNTSEAKYITAYDGGGNQLSPTIILYISTSIAPQEPVPTEEPTAKPPAQANVDVYYQGNDGANLGSTSFPAVEGEENRINAPTEINGYTLTGETGYNINVDGSGNANPSSVTFYYNPPQTPTPEPTQEPTPKPPAQVPVSITYQGNDGANLGGDSIVAVEGEQNNVKAPAEIDGYTLTGQTEYNINVDSDGNADPSSITFYYDPPATPEPTDEPTPKPPAQVPVSISYQGTDGTNFGSDSITAVEGEENHVVAPPAFGDYTLTGETEYYITVDSSGNASPAAITFYYNPPVTPEPTQEPTTKPPSQKVVDVYYRGSDGADMGGTTFTAVEGQENRIDAPSTIPGFEAYTLSGDSSVYITVDGSGNANPATVTFQYTPSMISVPVIYLQGGQPLGEDSVQIPAGSSNVPVNADPNRKPAGYQLEGAATVSVSVDTKGRATPETVTFNYIEIPAQSVQVSIEYAKEGVVFQTDSRTVSIPGTATVDEIPGLTPEGFRLEGAASVQVTVDSQGAATPAKVVFNYIPNPVAPALVPVEYVKDGQVFQTYTEQISAGTSKPVDMKNEFAPAGYYLEGASSVNVTVDALGAASPNKVVFNFIANPVGPALVPVEYVKDGQVFQTYTEQIAANSSKPVGMKAEFTPDGYQLDGPSSVNVAVDANGTATPNKVTFTFVKIPAQSVQVSIEYVKDGAVFETGSKTISIPGTATVDANPGLTPNGYKLNGPTSVNVAVDAQGVATPSKVTFSYVPSVTETPIPVGSAIDRWGVTSSKVNFRSAPVKNNKNLIKEVPQGTHVWMYESQYNEANEVWTRVRIDGQDGYIMTEFVDMMTQAQSDQYQASLPTPMPTRSPVPTTSVSPAPTTPPPSQYTGYALTNRQVALRVEVSDQDQSILTTLPLNTLVLVAGQVNQGTQPWSLVETLDEINGYVPDDALRRITPEEAKYYIDQYNAAHPTNSPTPSPSPSPTPVQQSGYATTLGDNVPMRGAADPNSMLVNMLAKNTIVYVSGQEYLDNIAWHIVRLGEKWGYIRADQLRWLSRQETEDYLKSLNTPTPTPAPTPPPLDQNSPSSYGYVNKDGVNFRKAPGNGTRIRLLNKYSFALVLGSTQLDGKTWYKVNQAGTEGYISSEFFDVLSLAELEDFLQSPEYSQGTNNSGNNNNNNNNNNGGNNEPSSPEDWNVGTWTNPNTGLNASYEPFDPYTTPEPQATPTPSPTPEPFITIPPPTDPPVQTQSDSPSFIWLGLGVVLLGGFGGLYAYALHKSNQRKAAARAAQRRAAMQQNPQSGARPYARATNAPMVPPASGTQAKPGTPQAGAQRPQSPGSASPYGQRPAGAQPGTTDPRTAAARPAQPGAAPAARPGQQPSAFARPTGAQPGAQQPAVFRPDAQGNASAPDGQGGTTQRNSTLGNTTRQPRTARHTGTSDQNTPTDTNETL